MAEPKSRSASVASAAARAGWEWTRRRSSSVPPVWRPGREGQHSHEPLQSLLPRRRRARRRLPRGPLQTSTPKGPLQRRRPEARAGQAAAPKPPAAEPAESTEEPPRKRAKVPPQQVTPGVGGFPAVQCREACRHSCPRTQA